MSTGTTPRTRVSSSMINSVGYDADTQTLDIEFSNGALYSYGGVPQSEYDSLMGAQSVGKYFISNIKNVYRQE